MRFSQYLAPALALAAAVEAVPTTPTYPPHGKPLVESVRIFGFPSSDAHSLIEASE